MTIKTKKIKIIVVSFLSGIAIAYADDFIRKVVKACKENNKEE